MPKFFSELMHVVEQYHKTEHTSKTKATPQPFPRQQIHVYTLSTIVSIFTGFRREKPVNT